MVTKKYKISLDSLARYAKLYPGMTVLDFINLFLVQEETLMLCKILVTLIVWIMGVVDVAGNLTGIPVIEQIDYLNTVAYYIEDNVNF